MANPIKGEVSFEAGDGRYKLSYSTNALCELEEELDMNVNEISVIMRDPANFRMRMVRSVFWAGLLDHQPDMDIKAAGQVLTHIRPAEALDLIGRAFALAFPDVETGGAVRPPEKSPGGNGETSSPRGRPSASRISTSGGEHHDS